jgi:hypothetical protein
MGVGGLCLAVVDDGAVLFVARILAQQARTPLPLGLA